LSQQQAQERILIAKKDMDGAIERNARRQDMLKRLNQKLKEAQSDQTRAMDMKKELQFKRSLVSADEQTKTLGNIKDIMGGMGDLSEAFERGWDDDEGFSTALPTEEKRSQEFNALMESFK